MSPEAVMGLAYDSMRIMLLMAGPLLLSALVVGLVVSLFQAATQINEMTLSFIPKILAVFIALIIAGPFMLTLIGDFTKSLFMRIPGLIG